MNSRHYFVIFPVLLFPLLLLAQTAQPVAGKSPVHIDATARQFVKLCAECHTVGGGQLTGPDLIGTTTWSYERLSAKIKTMEQFTGPLSSETVHSFTEFLKSGHARDKLRTAADVPGRIVGIIPTADGTAQPPPQVETVPAPPASELAPITTAEPVIIDTNAVQIDTVARYFVTKCAGCHTVGGGKLTGPDLASTATWPDAELATKIKTMQDRVGPIPPEMLTAYTNFLKHPQVKDRIKTAMDLASRAVAARLNPPDAHIGKQLFEGELPLANGGIACISCHRAGQRGGTMGFDLTAVSTRLGKVALTSSIEQAQYKVMSGTYKNHPITAQEAVHIAEYLYSPQTMPAASAETSVGKYGVITAIVGFGLILTFYRRRGKYTPRRRNT